MENAERNSRIRIILNSLKATRVSVVLAFVTSALTVSCANHPCREPKAPELDQTKSPQSQSTEDGGQKRNEPPASQASDEKANAGQSSGDGADGAKSLSTASNVTANRGVRTGGVSDRSKGETEGPKVRIYKPDGSKQCEKRGAVGVDAMERELSGIPVFARDKRSDGLMHVQVCGSPTGMINTFEIELKNLKKAEERGFRRLEE